MSQPIDCRFTVARGFHLTEAWDRRLRIGAGLEQIEGADCPQSFWRSPTAEELALLTQSAVELESSVCLFGLPTHLRSRWWGLLEQSANALTSGQLPGFDAFANQVVEFLAFKNLPVPQGSCCELVVSGAGERFIPRTTQGRLWGAINPGDEETSIVLVSASGVVLRLLLASGEGCRLPTDYLMAGCWPGEKREPDILLWISLPQLGD